MEETREEITCPPKDLTHIAKGKRTKRQRPQSPIPFTTATHSSSSNNGEYYNNNKSTSPAISSDFPASSTTEEEEDTAKCLILLSKGPSHEPTKQENYEEFATYKFNSKRYLPTPTATANGKAGIYVYECKTCSRTFPSFQALGGHRASHKKPKAAVVEEKRKRFLSFSDDEEPPQVPLKKIHSYSSSSSLSLQLNNRVSFGNSHYKSSFKVHECSICGAEFNSGQALGGHMRRHRVPGGTTTTTNPNTTLSLIPLSPIASEAIEDDKKPRNDGLSLDLNLPAPEDDFAFASKQQQSGIVLPATPTLVDCHY